MVLALTGDDDTTPYIAWIQGAGSEDFMTQFGAIMALVLDAETGEVVDPIDVDALLAEVETTFALSDVQTALADTFAQVLLAWEAIEDDVTTMVETVEGSVDGIVTEYDALITDEIHETS